MTLRNSNRGLKSALTVKNQQLASHRRQRFPRVSAQQLARQLRHWVETEQMIWTSDLFELVLADAKKQGFRP
jgi:hypothetical protein